MSKNKPIKSQEIIPEGTQEIFLFKEHEMRSILHNGERWYSVVDIVEVLAETDRPEKYWSDLKKKIENEGFFELSEVVGRFKMLAKDGKLRDTDAVRPEDALRIIQSISSRKAEPFKRWLAKAGYEQILETQNPDISIKKAVFLYRMQGRKDDWINDRIKSTIVRTELADEWDERGVKGEEYGILTGVIAKKTFGLTPSQHSELKGLSKKDNLRDNMTGLELLFTTLGEKSTTAIMRKHDTQGFYKNKLAAERGGKIAGDAREKLEIETGEKVVSKEKFLKLGKNIKQIIKISPPPKKLPGKNEDE